MNGHELIANLNLKAKSNWLVVMRLLDELPDIEAALVGEFDHR